MAVNNTTLPHVKATRASSFSQTRSRKRQLRPDVDFWRGILAVALCDILIGGVFTVLLGWRF